MQDSAKGRRSKALFADLSTSEKAACWAQEPKVPERLDNGKPCLLCRVVHRRGQYREEILNMYDVRPEFPNRLVYSAIGATIPSTPQRIPQSALFPQRQSGFRDTQHRVTCLGEQRAFLIGGFFFPTSDAILVMTH
jgi:hypothetical protein